MLRITVNAYSPNPDVKQLHSTQSSCAACAVTQLPVGSHFHMLRATTS